LPNPDGALTHLFPSPLALADADPVTLPTTRARAATLRGLSRAVADGALNLDHAAEPQEMRDQLLAMPGVGPWTADLIQMRALSDPDVFLTTDLGVKKSLESLSISSTEDWRPWRSYAVHHLWAAESGKADTQ
jgi:AraC family transcriptional regulator of adaptative response / DNA-3-methyladenine glycosylase II